MLEFSRLFEFFVVYCQQNREQGEIFLKYTNGLLLLFFTSIHDDERDKTGNDRFLFC